MLKQYSLKNKMKVLLAPSHKAPVVSVQMWVKTGSADEKRGEEGISHFIEHLVFKGTDKYGVGEIARTVEGSGGELNAYTSFDYTVFHVTISSSFTDVGLDTISQMMGFPKFDPAEINNERDVVIEEIKRSSDSPGRVSSQQIFSTVFRKHPYGIPVIGYDKIIKKVTPKTLLNYYYSRYVPSNMTLVVAGDLQPDLKRKIEGYFGAFQKHLLRKVKRKPEPKQKSPRISYKATEFREAQMNLAFTIPSVRHEDVPAIDLLGMILGQGDSSRLMKALRLERPLVTSVSAGAYNPLDKGLFITGLSFQAKNFQEIAEVLAAEFQRIVTEPISAEELRRARTKIESEEVFSLETVDGVARKVGMFQTLLNDPDYITKYLKKMHQLTPNDLLMVARKHFRPETLSVGILVHKEDSGAVSKQAVNAWVKRAAKALKSKPFGETLKEKKQAVGFKMGAVKINLSSDRVSQLEKITLSTGARVIFKENKGVPCFSIKAGVLAGARVEEDRVLGLTTALSNTWMAGTANRTEGEIAEEVENFGAQMSAFGGRNSIGLSLDALKAFETRTLDLFGDVLVNPAFRTDFIERELQVQREHIKSRADYPSSLAILMFSEEVFKNHPYGRDTLGTFDSLKNINQKEIQNYFRKYVTAPNAVFAVTGDFNKKYMTEFLEKVTGQLPAQKPEVPSFKVGEWSRAVKRFEKVDKNQTHILYGFKGLTLMDQDRDALQLVQSILSGQGGRLFIELRDKASLAYSVSPMEMEGVDAGYFGTYIACSPEKGLKAIDMMQIELDKLVRMKVSHDELERAKRYLIGRNAIDLQRNGSQASAILFDEIYGIDSREAFHYAERLAPITPEDVQRVASRVFTESGPAVAVAVGSQQPWV